MKLHLSNLEWHWKSAIFGGVMWLVAGIWSRLVGPQLGLIEQLLLLAPLVIVPLGLALPVYSHPAKYTPQLIRLIKLLQPPCAVLVTLAFLTPGGFFAGVMTTGWLGLTGLMALAGLLRFLSRPTFSAKYLSINVGFIYISVGGGWLALSRWGINPLGFDDVIVLLTAVHFHFAGFATLTIIGVAGNHLPPRKLSQRLHQISAFSVIVGIPLVAVGITFSPLLEMLGAIIIAAGLAILVYLIRLIVLQLQGYRLVYTLLTVSTISLLAGLLLILVYAVGEFSGYRLVTIAQMAAIHGTANALGFALCGLLAWNILQGQSHFDHHPPD